MRQLCDRQTAVSSCARPKNLEFRGVYLLVPPLGKSGGVPTYLTAPRLAAGQFSIRATVPSAPLRAAVPADVVCNMRNRRRRVFIDTQKGRVSAGFTVAAEADAADVSMRLRERGWIAYRLRLEAEQHAWVATVIDWTRRAA